VSGLWGDAGRDGWRVRVAKINHDTQQHNRHHDPDMPGNIGKDALYGGVRAESDHDHNAAGAGSNWKCERVEDFLLQRAESSRVHVLGLFFWRVGILPIQKIPTHRRQYQASRNLHDRQRDPEEAQHGGSRKFDGGEKEDRADGNLASQLPVDEVGCVTDEPKKNQCRSERIDQRQ